MEVINGYRYYNNEDVYNMLERLEKAEPELRVSILNYVEETEIGIDRAVMLNIVSEPLEYNVDYLDSLDSAVTEKFIYLMEQFNLAY